MENKLVQKSKKYQTLVDDFLAARNKNHTLSIKEFCEDRKLDYGLFRKAMVRLGFKIKDYLRIYTTIQFGITEDLLEKLKEKNLENQDCSIAETIRKQLALSFKE
jgi:hypothetical protein